MFVLLDPTRRPVIGHRGDCAHAPENTLESLRQAVAKGVDALEFDVHLSRDGIPVLMHDPTVDRTTDGRGAIAERTVSELQTLDAGARFTADEGRTFPWRGRGVTIPTLEQALAVAPALPLIIELKTVEVARPALEVLRRTGNTGRVLIGSFLDEALRPIQDAGIPSSAASAELTRLYLPAVFRLRPPQKTLPFQAMCIPRYHRNIPVPVQGYAAMMRAAGGPVHVWTVNDPTIARRLWAKGVSGIISDDPATILAARGGAA